MNAIQVIDSKELSLFRSYNGRLPRWITTADHLASRDEGESGLGKDPIVTERGAGAAAGVCRERGACMGGRRLRTALFGATRQLGALNP